MVMVRSGSHGSGGVAGGEERQPLRGGGLELGTKRAAAAAPPNHAAGLKQEAARWVKLWRAPPPVRASRLVLCLLMIPAVLLLLQRWPGTSSPEWVFDAEPPADDGVQDAKSITTCD
ncbi:hypothetical protein ACP4OV_000347 [Aristida adscensionis]